MFEDLGSIPNPKANPALLGLPITGEAIFEIAYPEQSARSFKKYVRKILKRKIAKECADFLWASYLVTVGNGAFDNELKCEVDIRLNDGRSVLATGYGATPRLAFLSALDKTEWYVADAIYGQVA